HAVVGDGRSAELLLEDYVAALGAERDAYGLGNGVDALLEVLSRLYIECDLFCHMVPLLLLLLAVAGEDRQHVFLRDDQVLDLVDLEFVAGVLGVEHLVADLELHRHLGAVVQDPSGPHGLDDALLGLLLGGVRKDNPALGLFLFLDRLDHYAVGQRSQVHVQPSSAESVSTPYARALSTLAGRLLNSSTNRARAARRPPALHQEAPTRLP